MQDIKTVKLEKGKIKFAGDNKDKFDAKDELDSRNEVINDEFGNNEVPVRKNDQKRSMFKKIISSITLSFFISRVRLAFINLKQVFVKALIFHYFDLKYYIRIETNTLDNIIVGVPSQLTLDNLG